MPAVSPTPAPVPAPVPPAPAPNPAAPAAASQTPWYAQPLASTLIVVLSGPLFSWGWGKLFPKKGKRK